MNTAYALQYDKSAKRWNVLQITIQHGKPDTDEIICYCYSENWARLICNELNNAKEK